jgi:hypothetical protein
MQAKLHHWATADPGRRFDDLFNLVHDPATLTMAFARVAENQGARTPGVDGLTVIEVEERIGVPWFLHDLRAALKDGRSDLFRCGNAGSRNRAGRGRSAASAFRRSRTGSCRPR